MENLFIICLVNSGINSLFKFFSDEIVIVVMIRFIGYDSFLNKKNNGFFCFIVLFFLFEIYS